MFVNNWIAIITLEKIVEPMYYVCSILDVDFYTRENCRASVLSLSDIRCRLLP